MARKNAVLEKENIRLVGEIKGLKEKIEVLEEALAYISEYLIKLFKKEEEE